MNITAAIKNYPKIFNSSHLSYNNNDNVKFYNLDNF